MAQYKAEAPADTSSYARRQLLKLLSTAAGGACAMAIAGCAQEQAKDWERPDWFRSKRGSNGNGRGRR